MATRSMAAMEVPIVGSDLIQWKEVTVPSSITPSEPCAPPTENAASCHRLEDPSTYLIWRIHKNLPHALELIEVSACKEFPKGGLRLLFQNALCPFAFICRNQVQSTDGNIYLLYAVTVSGVAYLFRLRNFGAYVSASVLSQDEFVEFDLQGHLQHGKITCVAATFGCLVIGQYDGSIGCYRLGILEQSSPDFMHELRDDVGIGRLWGLIARGRAIAAPQDLIISTVCERSLLFVLHVDGSLRVWDLLGRVRILARSLILPELEGTTVSRLWVGNPDYNKSLIHLAILYKSTLEADKDAIIVHSIHFSSSDKIILSLESPTRSLHLEEGKLIDVKVARDKLWILKEDGSMLYDLFYTDFNLQRTYSYGLQDAFVADQLFQGSEHTSDNLIWASDSIFSSAKDNVLQFVSSIFLHRLLHPGVHQNAALRATIHDHNKHLTESDFHSLTVNGLRKEILSIIDSEGIAENPISLIYYWKGFCSQFFHHWCQNSTPYSLLVDSSSGAIGLIRKNSLSLFRCLEDIEQLIYGSFDEFGDFINSGLVLPDDDLDREILFEVLRCISSINHHLGKTASAVFYESLVSPAIVSSEDVIACLLKILVTGYSFSVATTHKSPFRADIARQKEKTDHKSQRKFSVDMLMTLNALSNKASAWSRVLDVVEKYLKYLLPHKPVQSMESKGLFNVNTSLLVQATSQVARVMLDSAFDILLLLCYLVHISGQVCMEHVDISRIQLKLIPMIQEILTPWLIVHLVGTTPSELPILEDFSTQLSSLHIDNNTDKRSRDEKLGTHDFTLANILLFDFPGSEDQGYLSSRYFADPNGYVSSIRNFSSWIIWGCTGEVSKTFLSRATSLATLLLNHGQYEAVVNLLAIIDAHSRKEKVCQSVQSTDGEWCAHLHLLGFCLLVQAHSGLYGIQKGKKVHEAVRCFFRAASGKGAHQALQSLSFQTGLPYPAGIGSAAVWKLHYYQWAMQIFEQYNLSEGACQFALAALEQVDEVQRLDDDTYGGDPLLESPTTIRGRLWANVFKFTLDLKNYWDAYCAIISNPDEDSKYICLRRFIIVLCEHGAAKILCDGELPFVGLMEKVEQELVWKAERSDIMVKPNPYKLLYAFEMYRHNWRKAATYMYQYAVRLRREVSLKECQRLSSVLQERLWGLSAAINALHLVDSAYAWIDSQHEDYMGPDHHSPNKKARKIMEGKALARDDPETWRQQCFVDIEKLENEYVLTSAQLLLAHANVKYKFTGSQTVLSDLVDLLIQTDLYDMAFTVLVKFWKGSGLKRELEQVFVAISQKCCPNRIGSSSFTGNYGRNSGLLTASPSYESSPDGILDTNSAIHCSKGSKQWEALELYLEKYKKLHARLPATVAETLLHTNPQIELPLWLVRMFKGGQRATSWGMTGQEPDPATLFRLYVDYGRYTEATKLLLEYLESFTLLRPSDVINRKRMSAIWFPYTAIEHLWCQLEDLRSSGHMVDQCETLKMLLHGALLNHLKHIKVDSDDALSSAIG